MMYWYSCCEWSVAHPGLHIHDMIYCDAMTTEIKASASFHILTLSCVVQARPIADQASTDPILISLGISP